MNDETLEPRPPERRTERNEPQAQADAHAPNTATMTESQFRLLTECKPYQWRKRKPPYSALVEFCGHSFRIEVQPDPPILAARTSNR